MISIKNAPRYLILINAAKNMLFILPVIMLFYGYKGVSMGDFFLIQGLSSLCMFAFEIPSGYVGDLFSRKKTLMAGFLGWICGYLCWIYGSGFWWILGGELLFGMSNSFISGTLEAYLYDLLKKNRKERNFHKKMAKMETFAGFGLISATLSGAFFYQFIGPENTVWLSIFCLTMALVTLFLMPDVPEFRRQLSHAKSKWQDIMDISKYAVCHPQIKWLMIYPAVYGTLTLILMWGLQPVMIIQQVPVFMFSIILGANAFCRTGWASISGKLLDKLGLNGIIKLLSIIIIVSTFSAAVAVFLPKSFVYPCLGIMILGSASVVLAKVVSSTLINHRIQSDERSTILSVKSMVSRLMCGMGMIALKPLFDTVGAGETFMISALLILPILWSASYLLKMNLDVQEDALCAGGVK